MERFPRARIAQHQLLQVLQATDMVRMHRPAALEHEAPARVELLETCCTSSGAAADTSADFRSRVSKGRGAGGAG